MDIADATISLWKETVGSVFQHVADLQDYTLLKVSDLVLRAADLANNTIALGTKEFYVPKKAIDSFESSPSRLENMLDEWDKRVLGVYKESVHLSLTAKTILPNAIELNLPATDDHNIEDGNTVRAFNAKTGYTSSQNDDGEASSSQDKSLPTTKAYGLKTEIITDGTTFENLAVANYGDVNKAELIATVNNASSIEELITAGETRVIIPILERKENNENNRIIGFAGQRDAYGVDIALDEQGNINFDETGYEFKLVKGKENLSQAILNRLKESVNKRIRLQYYGIKTTLPDEPAVSNAYIFLSIIQTLQMEPRIKEILGLYFKMDGDVLKIDIDYTDISGDINNFQGAI